MSTSNNDAFKVVPIGYIRRKKDEVFLDILDVYKQGLIHIDKFSHVQVLWWLDRFDKPVYRKRLTAHPPYNAPETGVFACRSPKRPNPIALTTAKIKKVDFEKGLIFINNIDSKDNSPIIDIKGYFPVCDRVKKVKVPEWASDWSEWYPAEGHSLRD